MWRLAYARDWLHAIVDRFVDWWIRRAVRRVLDGAEHWMADNARETEGP